jgi:hypothetical protein
MPKATKLTPTQYRILRNIRDYDGNTVAVGCYGLSQHGGFGRSCQLMQLKGWITSINFRPYHYALTDEGKRVLQEMDDKQAEVRNLGMTNRVRRVLYTAGYTESADGGSPWGFKAVPGTTPGVVRLSYVRGTDYTKKESSKRFGNDQITLYVRALQAQGYRVTRVNGVKEVDNLIVMNKG